MKLLTERRLGNLVLWYGCQESVLFMTVQRILDTERRAAAIFTFPFFSLRKSLWLKSTSLHVKPSKTAGIIAMGKDLKDKSPFYDSWRDESFILGPE